MTAQTLFSGIHVSGQGPVVVLLHSSLASARQWRLLVNLLQSDFTVINIDMLGYGQADKVNEPEHYNFDVELQRIKHAFTVLIPDQKYHLVGHSCGGALALKLAVEHSNKLLSFTLYEPVAFHLLTMGSSERHEIENFSEKINNCDNLTAAEIFTDYWNYPGFLKSLPEKIQQVIAQDIPKVKLDFIGLISEKYNVQSITKITCKSLIMSGSESPPLGVFLANVVGDALPNHTIKSFNAGHMAPITHADIVQPYIADFIRSV
jgi:pimeloyl-ACP methyl ester carboxylesterase